MANTNNKVFNAVKNSSNNLNLFKERQYEMREKPTLPISNEEILDIVMGISGGGFAGTIKNKDNMDKVYKGIKKSFEKIYGKATPKQKDRFQEIMQVVKSKEKIDELKIFVKSVKRMKVDPAVEHLWIKHFQKHGKAPLEYSEALFKKWSNVMKKGKTQVYTQLTKKKDIN
tara:strand:+ start:315 stop:827 length:513 start_codon:yes stop_codon:yes gene_type:complete